MGQEVPYQVAQQQIHRQPLPRPFQWSQEETEGQVVLLTHDGTEVTQQLSQALIQQGWRVVVLCLPGIEAPEQAHVTTLSLAQIGDQAVQQMLEQAQRQGSLRWFIHLHPAAPGREDIVQAVFWIAKHLQPIFAQYPQERCGFLAALRLDGTLGYGTATAPDWVAAGVPGLVKSLNREWPTVYCRAVDLHPQLSAEQVVERLLVEWQDTHVAIAEVGYDAQLHRITPVPKEVSVARTAAPFQSSDVVVVTGGAQGITAQCVIALAQTAPCTFLLLGRTPYHEEEPAWAQGITEEKALKQAVFRAQQQSGATPLPTQIQQQYRHLIACRSIRATVDALHQAGAQASYRAVDITDAEAVRQVLAEAGPITGIIHGAGALADKRIEKKTEADFAKVYGTKVQGLLNVLEAVDTTALRHLVLFSSIVGIYGNEGQADYALANDTLNKWALAYQHEHPNTRVLSINWGAWITGMATPYIQQEFAQRGITLLSVSEGVAHFMHLLSSEARGVVVVNNHFPAPQKLFRLADQTLRIQQRVTREENPFLEDHVIGGYPVMPFVTGLAWIANVAEQLFPSYRFVQSQDSKLFNGIIFNGQQADDYSLDLQVVRQDAEHVHLSGKVWSQDAQGRRRYHYGSAVHLATTPPPAPRQELPTFGDTPLKTRAALYAEGSLFHGPLYQGIDALWFMDEQTLWYTCRLPEPDAPTQGQFPLQTSKTFTTDAMCQGFLVWAYHHLQTSCLPAGMGTMHLYEPLPFDETFWVHLRITEHQGPKIVGDATALSAEGKVLVAAEAITLTASPELLSLYRQPTESLAVVDMDIRTPSIPDLATFHRVVYDGRSITDLTEEAPELTEQPALLRKTATGPHSPQAVVTWGDTWPEPEAAGEALRAPTFSAALATARRWLQQHPEGSVLLAAKHRPSNSEAVVRLMQASTAYAAQESVYATLGAIRERTDSALEAQIPGWGYWEVTSTTPPLSTSPTDSDAPTCALGTLSLPDALQNIARLIKVSLSLHYRFIPALPSSSELVFAQWAAERFYAPEYAFPWIPENQAEERTAALSLSGEAAVLSVREATPPAPKAMTYLRQQDHKLVLVSGNDRSAVQAGLTELSQQADFFSHSWAAERYRQHQSQPGQYTVSLIAHSREQLAQEIAHAQKGVEKAFAGQKTWQTPGGSYFSAEPLGPSAQVGFVYPGLASAYGGMAKDYLQLFPQHLDYYSAKIDQLHELVHHSLVHPRYLSRPDAAQRRAQETRFLNNTVASAESSISMSVLMTRVLQQEFGIHPEAALGYSMGGITMLFALEVWGFQHLHSRVQQSPMFQPHAAYEHWAHWVLNAPADQVQPQLASAENLYLTFINTPESVIISGDRLEGEAWLQRHRYEALRVDLHNVAHCPPIRTMYQTLEQMHRLEIEKTPAVQCYSGVTHQVLTLEQEALARNAAETYCQPVDFVGLVRQAHQDGVNVFVEVGPQAWCSRLIGDILPSHSHVALSIDQKGISNYRSLLKLSGVLASHGVPLRLPYYETWPTSPSVSPLVTEEEQPVVIAPTHSPEPVPWPQGEAVLRTLDEPCYLYRREGQPFVSSREMSSDRYETVGILPAHSAGQLGSAAFQASHGVKFAYMAGAMANGIASEDMVIALGQQGMLGSFGAAGLRPERIEQAIHKIQEALPQGPYAFNLIHTPGDEALEMKLVTMYLHHRVDTLEASAFMEITLALVYYRAAGLTQDAEGQLVASNKIIAKVSRAEVARPFMQPAPEPLLDILVRQGKITAQQQAWARQLPMADDITVEADSGGHTDRQPLVCALPEMLRLRERIQQQYAYAAPPRVGAAGGISTPASVVGAFALGADYVVTGSINQTCREAGTSPKVKELLAQASSVDVGMAPSADMFELGVSVQVLKRGTLYANRAKKLYQLYQQYASLEEIPGAEQQKLEKQLFQKSIPEVWQEVEIFFQRHDQHKLASARQHPKKKMALVFRWYLGLSSKWAVEGAPNRAMDYQVWCGPAMGAFNDWVKGSPMEALEHRDVVGVARRLLNEAALQQRMQLLKLYGVLDASPLSIPADLTPAYV